MGLVNIQQQRTPPKGKETPTPRYAIDSSWNGVPGTLKLNCSWGIAARIKVGTINLLGSELQEVACIGNTAHKLLALGTKACTKYWLLSLMLCQVTIGNCSV